MFIIANIFSLETKKRFSYIFHLPYLGSKSLSILFSVLEYLRSNSTFVLPKVSLCSFLLSCFPFFLLQVRKIIISSFLLPLLTKSSFHYFIFHIHSSIHDEELSDVYLTRYTLYLYFFHLSKVIKCTQQSVQGKEEGKRRRQS